MKSLKNMLSLLGENQEVTCQKLKEYFIYAFIFVLKNFSKVFGDRL